MPYKMKGFPMVEGTEPMKVMKDAAMKKMHASPTKAMSPKKAMKEPMKKMHDGAMKKMHDGAMKAMKAPMKKMEGAMKAMDGAMKAMSPKKAMDESPKKAMDESPKKAMSPKKKGIAKDKRDVNAEWDKLSEGKKRSIIDDYYAQVNPKNPEKD